MKNALWFSADAPTPAMLSDIYCMGYNLRSINIGRALARRDLSEFRRIIRVLLLLSRLANKRHAEALFGVFPVPIQAIFTNDAAEHRKGVPGALYVTCYSFWGTQGSTCEMGKFLINGFE